MNEIKIILVGVSFKYYIMYIVFLFPCFAGSSNYKHFNINLFCRKARNYFLEDQYHSLLTLVSLTHNLVYTL